MKRFILLFILFLSVIRIDAQETLTKTNLVVLPIISNGLNQTDVYTSESILRMELGKQSNINLISERKTLDELNNSVCDDEDCAKQVGSKLGADQVLLCKLNPLGEKIIVQYTLVEVSSGKNLLSEITTALSVEDLEPVMKRVALSVSRVSPFNANQEVGTIVGKESIESLRRASRYNFGIGFGYLYPNTGYDKEAGKNNRSFTVNGYFDYELQEDYAVGLMVGVRKGFAMNIYGNYLFSKTDVCPYVGGALGFHWVTHDDFLYSDSKNGDGIELGLEAGLRIFHTYNFQLFIKGEYILTFNDYNDRAFVFTIGIL